MIAPGMMSNAHATSTPDAKLTALV
jgi:hypothetical protein